jgi:hypothetical protein
MPRGMVTNEPLDDISIAPDPTHGSLFFLPPPTQTRLTVESGASQALPRRTHNLAMFAADDKSRCQLIITSHSLGDHALFL